MSSLAITLIGVAAGLVIGVVSARFLGTALERGLAQGQAASQLGPERMRMLVRVLMVVDVAVLAVIGGLVAHYGFGGSA